MPSCTRCGAYTKYPNGLCYNCYSGKKSKGAEAFILACTELSLIYNDLKVENLYDSLQILVKSTFDFSFKSDGDLKK